MDKGLDRAAMLVDLNRVNEEVVAVITVRFTRTLKRRTLIRTQTVLRDQWETEQRRQTLTLRFARFHRFAANRRFRYVGIGAYANMAQLVEMAK